MVTDNTAYIGKDLILCTTRSLRSEIQVIFSLSKCPIKYKCTINYLEKGKVKIMVNFSV